MPRTATALAAREDEETTTHVDELIQRGRGQGYLSLPELRDAFDKARVSTAEARSIIRELTEAGVQLGNEPSDAADPATAAELAAADPEAGDLTADLDAELAELAAGVQSEAALGAGAPEAGDTAGAAETDLDDQTSVMGDSVHTYLKSIGRLRQPPPGRRGAASGAASPSPAFARRTGPPRSAWRG